MIAAEGFTQFDTVQGRQGLSGGDAVTQGGPDANDLAADARRDMGNPVGIGLHLAGGADDTGQPLFFCRSNNHAVLLLHLGGHLDAACLAMLVMSFMAFLLSSLSSSWPPAFSSLWPASFFSACSPPPLLSLGGTIEKAATQGNGQDKSDNDCFFVHCTPPVSSVATADSSFTKATLPAMQRRQIAVVDLEEFLLFLE